MEGQQHWARDTHLLLGLSRNEAKAHRHFFLRVFKGKAKGKAEAGLGGSGSPKGRHTHMSLCVASGYPFFEVGLMGNQNHLQGPLRNWER